MRLRGTQQPVVVTAKRLLECNQPCNDRKCHVALKQRKALNFAFTPSRIEQSRRQSLRAMQQSYAAICLISTRKARLQRLDFRVTASLKSQWSGPPPSQSRCSITGSRTPAQQVEWCRCTVHVYTSRPDRLLFLLAALRPSEGPQRSALVTATWPISQIIEGSRWQYLSGRTLLDHESGIV